MQPRRRLRELCVGGSAVTRLAAERHPAGRGIGTGRVVILLGRRPGFCICQLAMLGAVRFATPCIRATEDLRWCHVMTPHGPLARPGNWQRRSALTLTLDRRIADR